jgi:hypothetical protein
MGAASALTHCRRVPHSLSDRSRFPAPRLVEEVGRAVRDIHRHRLTEDPSGQDPARSAYQLPAQAATQWPMRCPSAASSSAVRIGWSSTTGTWQPRRRGVGRRDLPRQPSRDHELDVGHQRATSFHSFALSLRWVFLLHRSSAHATRLSHSKLRRPKISTIWRAFRSALVSNT